MKKNLKNICQAAKTVCGSAGALAIWTIVAIMVPNIVFCFTEPWSMAAKIAGILLPAGLYMALLSLGRKIGRTVWCMFPFIFFSAFQVVLLYLYGESVIAVDMFLNVFTTNVAEASQLLLNLLEALAMVAILYVVPLVWGGIAWFRSTLFPECFRRRLRFLGIIFLCVGLLAVGTAYLFSPGYNIVRETFPLNAIDNLTEAVARTSQMRHYGETSRGFSYNAHSEADPDKRELYILVIGETGRAMNWQLGGYGRPTNPRLSKIKGLTYFPRGFTESNTTHKSVPMLMSFASAENFDSIYRYKSIITAFKEAGYNTAFFSNQVPNRSYTQFFAEEADTTIYLGDKSKREVTLDGELLPLLKETISKGAKKQLVVLHTYGSHFLYSDRYPSEMACFTPDSRLDANRHNRPQLINAFDNTIRYTDFVLSEIIAMADSADCRAAVLYSTDHGEDIFDDDRERFLHASPVPTAYQLHVPVLCWLSKECEDEEPRLSRIMQTHKDKIVSPQKSLFMTALDIASISSPYYKEEWSLCSPSYNIGTPVYLTDRNETKKWDEINLKKYDLQYLDSVCGLGNVIK